MGDRERELRASRGRAPNFDVAMMQVDGLFDNCKPKPGTFIGCAAFLEGLQQVRYRFCRDAGAIVLHHDRAAGTDCDPNFGAGRRMAYGVLYQIAQRITYGGRIARDASRLANLQSEAMMGSQCPIPEAVNYFRSDFSKVQLRGVGSLDRLQAGEGEQSVDGSAHLAHILPEVLDPRLGTTELERHHG